MIGQEESEQPNREPVRYVIEASKRKERGRPDSHQAGASTAPMPRQSVEKGILSNALVVGVIEKKQAVKAGVFASGYIQTDETRVPVQVLTREGVNHTGCRRQRNPPGGPVVCDLQMDCGRAGARALLEYREGILLQTYG